MSSFYNENTDAGAYDDINPGNGSGAPDDMEAPMIPKVSQAPSAGKTDFSWAASLANRLPTGTVLTFQLLSPVLTETGSCSDLDRILTICLLVVLALACFTLCFTDSFVDSSGIRYGFATFSGLWIIDGGDEALSVDLRAKHLTAWDFLHAFTSVLVFAGVVVSDSNTVSCFCPDPSRDVKRLLTIAPMAIGLAGSALFVGFPSLRHGIGYPVTHMK